jgi:hypothetical protein
MATPHEPQDGRGHPARPDWLPIPPQHQRQPAYEPVLTTAVVPPASGLADRAMNPLYFALTGTGDTRRDVAEALAERRRRFRDHSHAEGECHRRGVRQG